jgi:glutamate racemase
MTDNPSIQPVGVFDSGVGGLSVLREIRRELPYENLIYVADSAHAPYGDKTSQFIEARSTAISDFLLKQNAKTIVVACNTATGAAIASLRAHFPALPIVAMEPAVKPAVNHTRTGIIGVLATQRTLASHNFGKLFQRFGAEVKILSQACPGLVEQVETGDLTGPKTRQLLEHYLLPLLQQGADTIVLGCTHYPFLAAQIQAIAGPSVAVIDSSPAIARQLKRRLSEVGLLANGSLPSFEQFWSSGHAGQTCAVIRQLWQTQIEINELPKPWR